MDPGNGLKYMHNYICKLLRLNANVTKDCSPKRFLIENYFLK